MALETTTISAFLGRSHPLQKESDRARSIEKWLSYAEIVILLWTYSIAVKTKI